MILFTIYNLKHITFLLASHYDSVIVVLLLITNKCNRVCLYDHPN